MALSAFAKESSPVFVSVSVGAAATAAITKAITIKYLFIVESLWEKVEFLELSKPGLGLNVLEMFCFYSNFCVAFQGFWVIFPNLSRSSFASYCFCVQRCILVCNTIWIFWLSSQNGRKINTKTYKSVQTKTSVFLKNGSIVCWVMRFFTGFVNVLDKLVLF